MRPRWIALVLGVALGACSSSSSSTGASGGTAAGGAASGGAKQSGGATGSGGASSNGGSAGSGGAVPSGGASGGAVASGGSTAAGGSSASGGASAGGTNAGGAGASGGLGGKATGGNVGGSAGSGGATGTGGTSTGAGGSASGGTTTSGGTTATGGTNTTGGATGTGGSNLPPVTCTPAYTGSATRPQLTDAAAACYTIKNYLAQAGTIGALVRDDWDPSTTALTVPTTPTYTVAADGSGTHTTVQAAITAALASGSTSRIYILVKPGTYRELVCVKPASGVVAIPVTLYGADADASKVTIVFNNGTGVTVTAANTNPCSTPSGTTHATSDSSTVFVSTRDFQAMNLTIANDFAEPSGQSTVQAPALTAQADQLVFQNVRFLGNQDTLQIKSGKTTTVARSYFKSCYVEGDVDFVFGRGTAVFDSCTFRYITSRTTGGSVFAPSTESTYPFGILVIGSTIGSSSGSNITYLGRAWDDSAGTSPNGQIVIRESTLDASIHSPPWNDSTANRAYSASGNRMYEYKNTGAGAAK